MTDEPGDQPPTGPEGSATPATAPAVPPPPQDPGTHSRPVFRRSASDRVLAGVAGGLARTFDVDPVIVRIVTVVLALAFPPVFIAYLAAWLLVARDDEPSRPPTGGIAFRQPGGVAFWIGVVVLAAITLSALDAPFGYGGGFSLVPLVLIGIGVALWTREGDRTPRAGAPSHPYPTTTPSTSGTTVSTTTPTAPAAAGGAPPPTQPPTADPHPEPAPVGPPPPRRPSSPLGAITIALALIATGIVAALDQVPELPLDAGPVELAAVALLALGLGQLVGTFWGRARWLTLVAVFLVPPVLVGTVVQSVDREWDLGISEINLGDGIGDRTVLVAGTTDLPDEVDLAAGSLVVDLEDWTPTSDQRDDLDDGEDLTIDVGAGEVEVVTPTDVPWRLVGNVRIGELVVDGIAAEDGLERQSTEDVGTPLEVLLDGGPPAGPDDEVLDIVVDVRLGQLTIRTPPFDAQELS